MHGDNRSRQVDAELLPVLRKFAVASPSFIRRASAPTWPISKASWRPIIGRSEIWALYSRESILRTLQQSPPVDAAAAGWQSSDYGLRRLGPDTYLFTYTLRQAERLSRRATIWQGAARNGASSSPGHDRLRLTFHGDLRTVERQQRMMNDRAKFVATFRGEAVDMSGEGPAFETVCTGVAIQVEERELTSSPAIGRYSKPTCSDALSPISSTSPCSVS